MDNSERRFSSDKSKRKDTRPICSNCGYKGHTADKCYKLHGYPSGYRLANSNNSVHQRQNNTIQDGNDKVTEVSKSNQSAFFASLNSDQYTRLLGMLQTHLNTPQNGENLKNEITHIAGIYLSHSIIP